MRGRPALKPAAQACPEGGEGGGEQGEGAEEVGEGREGPGREGGEGEKEEGKSLRADAATWFKLLPVVNFICEVVDQNVI